MIQISIPAPAKRSGVTRTTIWTWRVVWRTAPGPALGLLVINLIEGLGPAVGIWAIRGLINAVTDALQSGNRHFSVALPWLIAFLISLIASPQVIWYIRELFDIRLQQDLRHELERRRMRTSFSLPLFALEESAWLNRLQRSAEPGKKLYRMYFYSLIFLQGIVQSLAVTFLFWKASPWLTFALLATLLPYGWLMGYTGRLWIEHAYGQTERNRRAEYIAVLLTGRREQKELRIYGLHDFLADRWRRWRASAHQESIAIKQRVERLGAIPVLIQFVMNAGIAVVLAFLLARNQLTIGLFVALFQGVTQMESVSTRLSAGIRELSPMATDAMAVRDFFDHAAPLIPAPNTGVAFPQPMQEGIRFEHVTFTYPSQPRPILRDLNFHLRPGERVAIVGANGAGKSTLVKLLLGLYEPTSGSITVDGIRYDAMDREQFQQAVSVVFQDFYNFELAAAESIGLGRPDFPLDGSAHTTDDVDAVRKAALLGGADDFAQSLPRGYATPLGYTMDDAVELSGGQWQRVAISRAYMREDAALWILDEPTAALDPSAEAELYAQFAAALAGRTALLISHRLGSARMADRIVVLEQGQIVEGGTHNELLNLGGTYKRMWEAQAKWYK